MKNADILLAPYSSVLNQRNRKNIGLDLKDCYVVIDESHNIINAITECHSGTITERQIISSLNCVEVYRRTYIEKMLPRKIMFVDLSLRILRSLKNFIDRNKTRDFYYEERKTFIEHYNFQTLNFFDIWDYYEEQALPIKMFNVGFKSDSEARNDLTALKNFHEFVLCLDETDGEFLVSKDTQGNFTLKFMLLNPYNKFSVLLQEASCIVLAGGTLTPHQEFNQLFRSLERSQFVNFSCEHVVPSENLILTTISTSEKGEELKFTYGNREDHSLFTNLGDILCKLCQIVPHGIVVFLPSYSFLTKIQEILLETHIPQMMQRKEVFFDNRDENILKEYSSFAETRGAILFAVIRGSLSEGINFSDRLGRCVVIVGMPYLNSVDPEVIVKKIYYDKTDWYSGKQYYENSCDVAINQSIGRAIRHARDFAAIVLVDSRHGRRISCRPGWMIRSAVELRKVEDVFLRVRQFFRSKINT
jgi:chromosome transmission fidelity protein 1